MATYTVASAALAIVAITGGAARAGSTHANPPVQVVPRGQGSAVAPDDLPGPQPEVVSGATALALPAVPSFEVPVGESAIRAPRDHTADAAASPSGAAPECEAEIDIETDIPLRTIVDTTIRNASVEQLNACNKALAGRHHDAAIAACRAATDIWPDNHLAWYASAAAYLMQHAWPEAVAAAEHAVALRPDLAMYQLYVGVALYEADREHTARSHAHPDPAHPAHPAPAGEATPAQPAVRLAARDALRRAARIDPRLWRAHYYLGRIYRDLGDARRAAEQLTLTLTTHPGYRAAYIALGELYRQAGYLDQAITVARLGTAHVAAADAAELWLALALAYDAKHADNLAIDALGRALASEPNNPDAKLLRGEVYVRKGDLASARRDLGDVARSTDARAAAARPLATELLARIAGNAKPPATGEHQRYWKVYRPAMEPYQPWRPDDRRVRF